MNYQENTSIIGHLLAILYAALVLAGFLLTVTYGMHEKSVFRPTPYTLGNTYDAKTVQLAENCQHAYENVHHVALNSTTDQLWIF